jgi:hypothetical protein
MLRFAPGFIAGVAAEAGARRALGGLWEALIGGKP